MAEESKSKYTAVKICGFNRWYWFKTDSILEEGGQFKGAGGWGKGGAYTDLTVNSDLIEGRVTSECLQYE